jgi:hypothetical protein
MPVAGIADLDDDIAEIPSRHTVLADLGSRPRSRLHGCVVALELRTVNVTQELRPIVDVEIVSGHVNLLSVDMTPYP